MFRKLKHIFKYIKLDKEKLRKDKINISENINQQIPNHIDNIEFKLKEIFQDSNDFIIRKITTGNQFKTRILIAYIDGLIDKQLIDDNILKPLLLESQKVIDDESISKRNIIELFEETLITASEIKKVDDFNRTIKAILSGDTVIFIDGTESSFVVSMRGWEARAISEPNTESVIRGPREGFVETLRTNTSMIRRKIKNPNLKFESIELGEQTRTEACICYLKGIADDNIIRDLKKRLSCIKSDGILESGYIEQFIEDAPFSPFPTIGVSERPDKVAGKILEGRIAILCDGTPFVLTVPYLFIESLQSNEDYYSRTLYSSFNRLLRFVSLIITTMLPALYVAILNFHTEVIPVKLVFSILNSNEGIPFEPVWEAIFMLIIFELIREAGVRMPKPIGQTVSIVGALVIGQAVVEAGLVSDIMIIIVALTAISGFIVPSLSEILPFIRLALIIGANILGYMGIVLIVVIVILHISSLRSFGVPYMSPFAPFRSKGMKDTLIRMPLWTMFRKTESLSWKYSGRYSINKNFNEKEE
ncbi:spore germination protein [Clostridium sp. D2Q-11]|uniref:Spore germination protein n=1 Tax=Anaeromonas frigoriresistens TaxID=2683708 RepID=A0A942Z9Z7_9FIRM|nr:spore germination protein [Anaeromonas frigoriresistens]MBS4539330.1 spore germination protein [Anaeromonas frigoriresistens]